MSILRRLTNIIIKDPEKFKLYKNNTRFNNIDTRLSFSNAKVNYNPLMYLYYILLIIQNIDIFIIYEYGNIIKYIYELDKEFKYLLLENKIMDEKSFAKKILKYDESILKTIIENQNIFNYNKKIIEEFIKISKNNKLFNNLLYSDLNNYN